MLKEVDGDFLEKYSELKVETYHNIPVKKEYSKIYFCSYDTDFENCFQTISEEIWEIKKTVAFWHRNVAVDYFGEETIRNNLLSDLRQMQLFIVPVTYEFLYTDNKARLIELPFAIENNIPVLPILQDSGLASEFNEKCGNLQALDRNMIDSTAISYNLKLKKYLESVLISDELVEKIKASFSAYIFLSYRKKDRKLAQDVMKVIHSNDFCRDVAIWYDEYLTPGENFNETILAAMLKSQLFVLVVTPQILERPNYVMSVEYPMAWKYNKSILPIIAQETKESSLQESYHNIPRTVDILEKDKMRDTLAELLNGNLTEKNDDSNHLYYMGLAYLSGIDVEVDSNRAVVLLEQATRKINLSALKKLVEIYKYGIGVKKDIQKAIEWQKTLIALVLAASKIKKTKEICKGYISSLIDLVELYEEKKEYGNIRKNIQLACNFIESDAAQFDDLDIHIMKYDVYLKICKVAFQEENIEEYVFYFRKCDELIKKCADKMTAIDKRKVVEDVVLKEYELKYTREIYAKDSLDVKLAEIKLERAKIKKQRIDKQRYDILQRYILYISERIKMLLLVDNKEEAQENVECILKNIDMLDFEKYSSIVALVFNLSGKVFKSMKEYKKAEDYLKKSIVVCENSTDKYNIELINIQIEDYCQLANIYWEKQDFQAVDSALQASLQICLELVRKNKNVNSMLKCIEIYERLGNFEKNTRNLKKEKEYFLAAYQTANELYDTYKEAWANDKVALIASYLEDIANLQKNTDEAISYHDKTLDMDVERACMSLTLKNREGRNKLFNKILLLGQKIKILANEPYLIDWLIESYNMMGDESDSLKVNDQFSIFFEELIRITEHIQKRETDVILMKLHTEFAVFLLRTEEKEQGRQEKWIAIQIGKKLLQEKFEEELAQELLEICSSLDEDYQENNLEEEWPKRIDLIAYKIELSSLINKNKNIGEILEKEFYRTVLEEAAQRYDNAERRYKFLLVLIQKLDIAGTVEIYKNIEAYYNNMLLDLLVVKECYQKNISIVDFLEEYIEQLNVKANIDVEKLRYYSYLGMARINYINGKYKEGYNLYLFILDNIRELDEGMIKSLKLSMEILLERKEDEDALRINKIAMQFSLLAYETLKDYDICCDVGYFYGLEGYLCVRTGNENSALKYYQSAVEYNEYGIENLLTNSDPVNLLEPKEFILMKLEELLKLYKEYNEILKRKGRFIKRHSNEIRIKEIEKQIRTMR